MPKHVNLKTETNEIVKVKTHYVDSKMVASKTKEEILEEVTKNPKYFPSEVLTRKTFGEKSLYLTLRETEEFRRYDTPGLSFSQ